MDGAKNRKLVIVKSVHTAIWAVLASLIFYLLYAGLSGNVTPLAFIAIAAIVGESLILLIYRWRCPLTVVARKYSDSDKANFDIYLPEWLARENKTIFGLLFLVGVALVVWRVVQGG